MGRGGNNLRKEKGKGKALQGRGERINRERGGKISVRKGRRGGKASGGKGWEGSQQGKGGNNLRKERGRS